MKNSDLLRECIKQYDISLSDRQCVQFEEYSALLRIWNEKMNLTAITDEEEIIIKHFSDSLSIMPYLPKGEFSLIDVGTGAGFPGIPLKIANPDISLTLLDSLEKRIKFLKEVLSVINAENYSCVHARAEDAGHNPIYREQFDVCTARAVAKLPVLLEYCLPFLKVNGIFIAMKGSDITEVSECKDVLKVLGSEIIMFKEFQLFGNIIKRTVIVVRKERQLSTKFPRNSAKIAKYPLNICDKLL